ncbi:MAG: adenosylcobinamide-GDP ribazoletransferase [Thermosphaera sp.]
MASFKEIIKSFFFLVSFFTIIPVLRKPLNTSMFKDLYLLPLVGLVRGGIAIVPLTIYQLTGFSSTYIIAFTVVAFHFILQGFLHADGLIDFSEAILAHRFGANGYKVVKDKYRGSYAIASFCIYTLGLFSFIIALTERLSIIKLMCLLVISEVWSTTNMVILSYSSKEPPEGFGKAFKENLSESDVILSAIISFVISFTLLFITKTTPRFLIATLMSLVFNVILSRTLAYKVLGFVNGDVLGFSSELFYLLSLISYCVISWI